MAQGKRNEPTAIPSPAERAYAAGFIDGEGCISIGVQKNSWVAKLTVVQVDPRPLHLLAQFWGGAVSKKKPGPRRALAYEWRIVGKQFYRCMDDILSMLIVKQKAARNALLLRGLRDCRGQAPPMTKKERQTRERIKAESHRLNRRGPRP
jgi:hypothetical protein